MWLASEVVAETGDHAIPFRKRSDRLRSGGFGSPLAGTSERVAEVGGGAAPLGHARVPGMTSHNKGAKLPGERRDLRRVGLLLLGARVGCERVAPGHAGAHRRLTDDCRCDGIAGVWLDRPSKLQESKTRDIRAGNGSAPPRRHS
jgi:hypothetical protein